jgi:hypothetical protein
VADSYPDRLRELMGYATTGGGQLGSAGYYDPKVAGFGSSGSASAGSGTGLDGVGTGVGGNAGLMRRSPSRL